MKIERIELHHVSMQLISPFQTSFSTQQEHPCVLVSVHAEGATGWGECVAGLGPFYSSETIESAWAILKDYLGPMVLGQELSHPSDVVSLTRRVRGNQMLVSNIELQYPIAKQQLYALLFFDAGNSWLRYKDVKPFDLWTSWGLGFRILVPGIGTIGFDFAKPLRNRDDEGYGWHTHFQIGTTFR